MTFATIEGEAVARVRLHVPARGVWHAEADMVEAPDLDGAVTLTLGDRTFSGVVDARVGGVFALRRRVRLLGGAGGWATLLAAKAYHNDAQVRAQLVAEDAAREAGESIVEFSPEVERIGVDYVRQSGPASRVLEDVIGSAGWWVDFDGGTHVGERAESTPDTGGYELLDFDPRERCATLAVDDVGAVAIGALLEGVDGPAHVHQLQVDVDEDTIRVRAWLGDGAVTTRSRVTSALRGFVRRVTDERLFGIWPYRVVQMSSERVELQAVRRRAGLPDILPISMRPGVAGAHAELAAGTEVLVQFIEGDRAQPVITHFAGADGSGFIPSRLTLGAVSAANAAREGDTVRVTIPANTFLVAATGGTLNATAVEVEGEITSGSSKVGIG